MKRLFRRILCAFGKHGRGQTLHLPYKRSDMHRNVWENRIYDCDCHKYYFW